MPDVLTLIGGSEVHCSDGHCGSLSRLLIEPGTRTVSHVAVELPGLAGDSRLVPIVLVQEAADAVVLACSRTEFDALPSGEVRRVEPQLAIRGDLLPFVPLVLDRIPDDEVEVSGEERIEAADGHIGRLQGMRVAAESFQITGLLLVVGHFSGKKRVDIPADVIVDITGDGIKLSISRSQIGKLADLA